MRSHILRTKHLLGIPSVLAITSLMLGAAIMELAADLLDNQLLLEAGWVALLGCIVGASLFRTWRQIDVLSTTGTDNVGQPGTVQMGSRRGLVLVVGLESASPTSPAMKVLLAGRKLEWVALVGTEQTLARQVEKTIKDTLAPAAGLTLDTTHVRVFSHNNAEFISDAEQSVSEAIAWMRRNGLADHEIVVDVTAGRRSFCHGAFLAALEHHVETQLVTDAWDHTSARRISGAETIKLVRELYGTSDICEPDSHSHDRQPEAVR